MIPNNKKIAIIGGGILGLAIGYELCNRYPNVKIHIFEKENEIGQHQSGNNSGVLHCGLYYEPGSLKAKLAVEGNRKMTAFCDKHQVEYDICGKIVVATNDKEIIMLENLANRGQKNGLEGLQFLDTNILKKREPHVYAIKALLVPQEGIVSFKGVMKTMSDFILSSGSLISTHAKVNKVSQKSMDTLVLTTSENEYECNYIINCTGLFSDRVFSNLTGQKRPLRIIPFRGEYMHIKDEYKDLVNHLIYPVPDPTYPFLGVHFTRMINGGREVGPNAVLALKREGYSNKDFSLNDTLDAILYRGFLNFVRKNFSFAMSEFQSSFSAGAFIKKAKKLVPDIEEYMIEKGTAGVRAQAMDHHGKLIMDFKIEKFGNQIHILNAPSPGATASLAIAGYVIDHYLQPL